MTGSETVQSGIDAALAHISNESGRLVRELYTLNPNPLSDGAQLGVAIRTFALMGDDYTAFIRQASHDLRDVLNVPRSIEVKVQHTAATIEGTQATPETVPSDLDQLLDQVIETLRYIRSSYAQADLITAHQPALHTLEELLRQFEEERRALGYSENKEKSDAAVSALENVVDQAKSAAGVVADTTLSIHYRRLADTEQTRANELQRWSYTSFCAAVVMAGIMITWIIWSGEDAVGGQVVKLLATLPFIAIGFLLSHESSGHRVIERRAREFQIRLQTLDAFSAPMTDEQKQVLRAKIGESILAGPLGLSSGTEKQAIDADALISRLLDKIN